MNVQWALNSSVSKIKPQKMDWFTDLLNFQPTKENLIHKFCLFFINSKTIPYTHNVTSRRLKSRVFSLLHYFFIVAITFYLTVSPLK